MLFITLIFAHLLIIFRYFKFTLISDSHSSMTYLNFMARPRGSQKLPSLDPEKS